MTEVQNTSEVPNVSVKVFRFKFNKEIIDMLTYFTKLHQYDKREDYKEAWKLWYQENNESLQREADRLVRLGYSGNVEDKMYKAARYYYRKTGTADDEAIDNPCKKKDVTKKRRYITLTQEFLDAMDDHITRNIDNDNFTPAFGFDDFCKTNMVILAVQIKTLDELLSADNATDNNMSKSQIKNYISSKLKKTYKNRYFQYTRRE